MSKQYPIQLAQDINLNLYCNNDATQLMMIDVLTNILFHQQYNNKDNITFTEFLHSCNIPKIKNHKDNQPYTIKFNGKQLRKRLPFLKKLFKKGMFKLIYELEETIFNIKYPLRMIEDDQYVSKDNHVNSAPYYVVSLDNKENYEICFDTEFGMCLMNNVLYSHHNMVLEKFYNLSKTAQLFYRKLILPYWGKTKKDLTIERIVEKVGYNSNEYDLHKGIIPYMLDDLKNNNFIDSWKFDQITTKYNYVHMNYEDQRRIFKNGI